MELAVILLLAVLVGLNVRRYGFSGARDAARQDHHAPLNLRQRILLALTLFAVFVPALGIGLQYRFRSGVPWDDTALTLFAVTAIGVAPLLAFHLIDWTLSAMRGGKLSR